MKTILIFGCFFLAGCSIFDAPKDASLTGRGWACTSNDVRVCQKLFMQMQQLHSPEMLKAIEDARGYPAR